MSELDRRDPPDHDRRRDLKSRGRVSDLEQRYRRVARLLLGALVVQVVVVFVGFALLQDQRVDSLEDSCQRDNRQARGLRTVVAGTRPDFQELVADTFPIERDCRAAAERRAGTVIHLPPW